ncbi:MAG TPA: molybdate ABC transporter substrate-binding protein [Candidatus Sulfotelmatobacter sp.]|nr:molybdate ABC transporter substrate-binding protein [Candidatus Sulfotelmatobacter sp.]
MTKLARICSFLLPLLLLTQISAAQNKTAPVLVIAAAADLNPALKEIGNAYEKKTGEKILISFGSSGALAQQIRNGGPYDAFFSADMDYPQQLIKSGEADANNLSQYAIGKLVLWVPADSPLDLEHQGIKALLDSSVKKIAIANPQQAPYGRAAIAALKHAGLYDQLADKFVVGENVSQAAQFVESGNAQAGFIALAHALAPQVQSKGKYWEVPPGDYPPLDQGVVVLARSQYKTEAAAFVAYLKTKEAADMLHKYGFTAPQK